MSIELKEVLDAMQAEALSTKLEPTEAYMWRYFCRVYSKKFSTPLHEVLQLPPEHVILQVFEDQLDQVDIEEDIDKILRSIYRIEDPEFEQEEEDELKEFIKEAEADEAERIKNSKPIHPALKHEVSIKDLPKPTQGQANLSGLKSDEE